MLDEKTLQELKEKLVEEKTRLEESLKRMARKEGTDYETSFDEIGRSEEENAEEVEQYADNLGITDTLERNLSDVNEALEKMGQGTYGKCENCNEEIPVERLRAYPAARTCVKCGK